MHNVMFIQHRMQKVDEFNAVSNRFYIVGFHVNADVVVN